MGRAVALGGAAMLVYFAQWVPLARALASGRRLASARSPRFESSPPDASYRVLVVGDSSGVGLGADAPSDTVAGRLAAARPGTAVVNLARIGARTRDAALQLRRLSRRAAPGGLPYDLVLIHAGGNDAIHGTPRRVVAQHARAALSHAHAIGREVAWLSGGNLGMIQVLPFPLPWLLDRRTRRVHDVLRDACRTSGAVFVEMYKPRGAMQMSASWFASDHFHPSGEGYGVWYALLAQALAERRHRDIQYVSFTVSDRLRTRLQRSPGRCVSHPLL